MDINFLGHIDAIRYTDMAVIVTASERRQGYKKSDGTIIDDSLLTYNFIFKPYFKNYIANHFSRNMLVKIKGIMFPFAKDHQGNTIEGYSIIGQTIDRATYQTSGVRLEKRMMKESQSHSIDEPDIDTYNAPDF